MNHTSSHTPPASFLSNLCHHLDVLTASVSATIIRSSSAYSSAQHTIITMSSSSIPLYPIQASTASQWSFDSEDYQRLVKQHNRLYPPEPAKSSLFSFRRPHSPTLTYMIGDVVFLNDSLKPYTFLGITDTRRNTHNQVECVVELRSPAPTYPPTTVHLRLRRVHQCDCVSLEEDSKWSKWIKDLFRSIWCCLPD
jgi:hypothetical protein